MPDFGAVSQEIRNLSTHGRGAEPAGDPGDVPGAAELLLAPGPEFRVG